MFPLLLQIVGLVLIAISSPRSIQILTWLVNLIGIPLVEVIHMDKLVSKIARSLCSRDDDRSFQAAAIDCVCAIAYFARKEAIEKMLKRGVVEKLVELQSSSIHGGGKNGEEGARLLGFVAALGLKDFGRNEIKCRGLK